MSLPHASEQGVDDSGFFLRTWFRFFESIWKRIGGGASYSLGGLLTYDATQTGNVGTGEDDLISYTLPQNTVDLDGSTIEIIAFGTTADNTNNKTIKLYFGGTEIFETSGSGSNLRNKSWKFHCHILKTGNNTQKCATLFVAGNAAGSANSDCVYTATTKDFTDDLVIKCTGEATSNNDIIQQALIVNLNPR